MDANAERTAFPLASVLCLAAGCALAAGAFHLVPYDPCTALPRWKGVDDPLDAHPELRAAKAPGEVRVLFVGASLTAGFPYGESASFARGIEAGLAAVFPGKLVRVRALGRPSLDSPELVPLVEEALSVEPDAVWVVLGEGEVGARLFLDRDLVPRDWLAWIEDHASRSRVLFGALAVRGPAPTANSLLVPLLKHLPAARPGEPLVEALPVPAADREVLAERTRAAVRRMAGAARERGVPLALLLGSHNLAGAWPCGMTTGSPEVDAAVLAWRRSGAADLERARELVEAHPERADARFLLGRALLEQGDAGAARRELLAARELDPGPLHLIREVEQALLAEGAHQGLRVHALDEGLWLSGTEIPDPACFLDPGHWNLEGVRRVAAHVAELLSAEGVIPALPAGWEARFDDALAAHLAQSLTPEARARAESTAMRSAGLLVAALGNLRDGSYLLAGGLAALAPIAGRPDHPDWSPWALTLVRCAMAAAGRSAELAEGTSLERAERMHALVQRLWTDAARGEAEAFVSCILAGE